MKYERKPEWLKVRFPSNVQPHHITLPSPVTGRGAGGEGASALAASEAAVPA